jgi:DNA-binding XRE family transcriptional regulator
LNKQEVITAIEQYNAVPQEIVSANIRRLIIENGWYSIELARKVEVSQQTVFSWSKQKGNKPLFDTALKICLAFDVELEELMRSDVDLLPTEQKPKCATVGCNNEADAARGLCKKCYKAMRRAEKKGE